MQITFLDQPALRLISAKAGTFPSGIKDAYATIENRLPTLSGRKMYGLGFRTENGFEYHAGLVPESEREEQEFGFPIIEIPAGPCVSTTLFDWFDNTDQISALIGLMIAHFGTDPTRPTMVERRSMNELHLLVPITHLQHVQSKTGASMP
ncbi:MAG: hypothetical protein WCQ16_00415 [Verrucomicrobiae bacterium]